MDNIGAFFDIDGTLARNSLMEEHFQRLVDNKIIDEDIWALQVKPIYTNYKRRYTDYDRYLEVVSNVYNEALIGIPYDFIDYLGKIVIDEIGDVVYTYTRARIEYHKKQGHKIFFISGSPEFLTKRMAEKYQADDFRGTEFTTSDGKFTGEYKKMWDAEDKAQVLEEFRASYDLDFAYSYAYGDTLGDISMFKAVGNPIAINPSKSLLKYIQSQEELRKKMKIVVERKDVIYNIPVGVELI